MSKDCSLVAVVDDDISVRKAIQRLLKSDGKAVEVYPSGEAFLESLATQRPDCVVLDLHLSGITGFDVLSRMKETGVSIPIIIITGNDSPEIQKQAKAAGVATYLRKPFNDESLLTAVTGAMNRE